MPRITISYRRDDSLDITGRIFDRLALHFGREAVFRDIDNIPPGVDFRRHVGTTLDTSDIVLAIVGPHWIGPNPERSRLASPADPVRVEIETALRKDKPLIPVLVLHAVMPNPEQLPESLQDFSYRNAVQVDSGIDFEVHIERLIRAMDRLLSGDERTGEDEVPKSAATAVEVVPRTDNALEPPDAPQTTRPETPLMGNAPTAQRARRLPETSVTAAEPPTTPVSKGDSTSRRLMLAAFTALALALIAGGWWIFVEQPAEMARREAAAAEKARADERARDATDAKAQQEEQTRQAAAAKAQQEEQARQTTAANALGDVLAKGNAALERNDYAEAAKQFGIAANQGNAEGEGNLARLYANGWGVAKDYPEAMRLAREAATQGNARGQYVNGVLYEKGWGVNQDFAEAMRWYRLAADQGDAFAQTNIGHLYWQGEGVKQDYGQAAAWYRKAADQGNPFAENSLGYLYQSGSGLKQDYAEAMRWYRKAADQGNTNAQNSIGYLYQNGYGVMQDYGEAVRWYRMAAEAGNTEAQRHIGFMYQNAQGVPKDYAEAMHWYRKAADKGESFAQLDIGFLYQNGYGVTQDYAEAMRWYRMAADQGNARAEYFVGYLYENGWGVTRDLDQARQWWRKAAASGDDSAKKALAKYGG